MAFSGSVGCCGIARDSQRGLEEVWAAASSSFSSYLGRRRQSTRRWWALTASLPPDAEDGRSLADEEGKHNVENFMLCSFSHFACSLFMQVFFHEEDVQGGSNMSFFFVRVVLWSGLSGAFL